MVKFEKIVFYLKELPFYRIVQKVRLVQFSRETTMENKLASDAYHVALAS